MYAGLLADMKMFDLMIISGLKKSVFSSGSSVRMKPALLTRLEDSLADI